MTVKQLAQRVGIGSQKFLQGKASERQYAAWIIKHAEMLKKAFPNLNPDYKPMHADEDPQALQRLDAVGMDEVPDEDLNSVAEDEAGENIEFPGGLYDD